MSWWRGRRLRQHRGITPPDSPLTATQLRKQPRFRDLVSAKLDVGHPAHDFALPILNCSDGSEQPTGERFHLQAAAANRPVALIFGSYT